MLSRRDNFSAGLVVLWRHWYLKAKLSSIMPIFPSITSSSWLASRENPTVGVDYNECYNICLILYVNVNCGNLIHHSARLFVATNNHSVPTVCAHLKELFCQVWEKDNKEQVCLTLCGGCGLQAASVLPYKLGHPENSIRRIYVFCPSCHPYPSCQSEEICAPKVQTVDFLDNCARPLFGLEFSYGLTWDWSILL